MDTTERSVSLNDPAHHGHNIKRIRLLLGIPQKAVATALGAGWTQKKVSRIESAPYVMPKVRQALARFYKVDVEVFDAFDEAAGRMAISHMMKAKDQLTTPVGPDDLWLLKEIAQMLERTALSIDREREQLGVLLRLLEQAKSRSGAWTEKYKEDHQSPTEVNEPVMRLWRVA